MTPAGLYDLARPGAVVVLAPRWTNALAPAGDARLPRDGFVVLVAPPGVRRLAARSLGRGGWAVRQPLLAVPDLARPRLRRDARLAPRGADARSRTRARAARAPGG